MSVDRAWYFWERVQNINQSEARKQCFLASDWLKFGTLPRKSRITLYVTVLFLMPSTMKTAYLDSFTNILPLKLASNHITEHLINEYVKSKTLKL